MLQYVEKVQIQVPSYSLPLHSLQDYPGRHWHIHYSSTDRCPHSPHPGQSKFFRFIDTYLRAWRPTVCNWCSRITRVHDRRRTLCWTLFWKLQKAILWVVQKSQSLQELLMNLILVWNCNLCTFLNWDAFTLLHLGRSGLLKSRMIRLPVGCNPQLAQACTPASSQSPSWALQQFQSPAKSYYTILQGVFLNGTP